MKTLNPRLIVESILEGVDYVDGQLAEAIGERNEQYASDEDREAWHRVGANWLVTRAIIQGRIKQLLRLIEVANKRDLAQSTLVLFDMLDADSLWDAILAGKAELIQTGKHHDYLAQARELLKIADAL